MQHVTLFEGLAFAMRNQRPQFIGFDIANGDN
jgi:hypothetical protein